MNNIKKKNKEKLMNILEELIKVIVLMRKDEDKYFLRQNECEARKWLLYLQKHDDKEELQSLEDEISERYFQKYSNGCDHIIRDTITQDLKLQKYNANVAEYEACLLEYPEYREDVINSGADGIRRMLIEIYLGNSSRFLK